MQIWMENIIKALVIAFFYSRYKSLLDFFKIEAETTYVVKIMKPQIKLFYSTYEYKKWLETLSDKSKVVADFKKGLGSYANDEIDDIAQTRKVINYTLEGDEDDYIQLAFNKENGYSNMRKEWITRDMDDETGDIYDENETQTEGDLSISSFIDTELLRFERMTLTRAIPNVMDGKKESQRKIFFSMRKRSIYKPDYKVSQISGIVLENSAYEHGESSIHEAVIKMAQGFVGSNNLPLLINKGQFGSRRGGGKDNAPERYIFTALEKITKTLFSEIDDNILTYLYDGKDKIEPKFYAPIIPLLLANGAEGIASGFSTTIPSYNPLDLVNYIKNWLEGKSQETPALTPWWRGFNGEIELVEDPDGCQRVITEGKLEKRNNCKW